MNSLKKSQKLFISLFAVVALTLAGGHFCSAFNMADHHAAEPARAVEISYGNSYQPCCINKTTSQFTVSVQQVQKPVLDTQSLPVVAFDTLPISTTAASGSPLKSVLPEAGLDPGGGLVLRC